jgi:hypothetical protein
MTLQTKGNTVLPRNNMPGEGGTFSIQLAAFLHHYRVRQEIP